MSKTEPWIESLSAYLDPYAPAAQENENTLYKTTRDIITAIEEHHGVTQGLQKGKAVDWIDPDEIIRLMRDMGYKEVNMNGQLCWLLIKSPPVIPSE